MYFHAPCGVVLYSVMLCLYIVECNCNFYEHKKNTECQKTIESCASMYTQMLIKSCDTENTAPD